MSRSKWKSPFVDYNVLNEVKSKIKKEIQTKSRNSTILPSFVGKSFTVQITIHILGCSYSTRLHLMS